LLRIQQLTALAPTAAVETSRLALFGLLVFPSNPAVSATAVIARLQPLPAVLHDADLRANEFKNLTLGVFGVADIGTLQLESNRATTCFGGFWLLTDGFIAPPNNPNLPWATVQAELLGFAEIEIAILLGIGFPLPAGFELGPPFSRPATPLSVGVTSNRIDTLGQGTALALLLNRQAGDGVNTTDLLIVDSNQIHGRTPRLTTALAVLAIGGPTSLTGNVIVNPGIRPASLLIFQAASPGTILAITGNVLVGVTTVSDLPQWKPLNAIYF
jgi:hypothetical protein